MCMLLWQILLTCNNYRQKRNGSCPSVDQTTKGSESGGHTILGWCSAGVEAPPFEIDAVGESVVTRCITLEPISFCLVGNTKFVEVSALEANGLFIQQEKHTTLPRERTHSSNPFHNGEDLEQWTGAPVGCRLEGILTTKEGLLETSLCIWA